MGRRIKVLIVLSCLSIFLGITPLRAAVVPPANIDAGAVNKANNDYIIGDIAKRDIPKAKEDTIKPPEPDKTETKDAHIEKFQLKKIIFSGNTVYKSPELEKLAKNLIGKDITIDDAKNIADEITKLYRMNQGSGILIKRK